MNVRKIKLYITFSLHSFLHSSCSYILLIICYRIIFLKKLNGYAITYKCCIQHVNLNHLKLFGPCSMPISIEYIIKIMSSQLSCNLNSEPNSYSPSKIWRVLDYSLINSFFYFPIFFKPVEVFLFADFFKPVEVFLFADFFYFRIFLKTSTGFFIFRYFINLFLFSDFLKTCRGFLIFLIFWAVQKFK